MTRSIAAARSTRAAASPLEQTAEITAAFSPEGVTPQRFLEGEIESASEHSEIIFRSVDYAETQIVRPTEVSRDSKFETSPELAEHFGFASEVFGLRIDSEGVRRPLCVKRVPFAAAENRTHTRPRIRCKTSARNWITQRKRAKDSADSMIVIDSSMNKYRDRLVLEDIETRLVSVQCKSLNTETSIAAEEIFDVTAAAPCVIAANVTVIGAEHRTAFTGALNDVDQRRIRSELGVGECIRAPEIHVPFAIAVPLRTGRDVRDLFHLFSRILA